MEITTQQSSPTGPLLIPGCPSPPFSQRKRGYFLVGSYFCGMRTWSSDPFLPRVCGSPGNGTTNVAPGFTRGSAGGSWRARPSSRAKPILIIAATLRRNDPRSKVNMGGGRRNLTRSGGPPSRAGPTARLLADEIEARLAEPEGVLVRLRLGRLGPEPLCERLLRLRRRRDVGLRRLFGELVSVEVLV